MKDYAGEAADIQTAMVNHVRAHPDPASREGYILWNGAQVWTSYTIQVPKQGWFELEFLSEGRDPLQGFDVKAEGGEVIIPGVDPAPTLRTWNDPRLESRVRYQYRSKGGALKVWNVFQRRWPNGRMEEEKWTGNAGFLVECTAPGEYVFHCSPGPAPEPDFEQLMVRLLIDHCLQLLPTDQRRGRSSPHDR